MANEKDKEVVQPGETFVTQTGTHGPETNVDPSIKPNDTGAPAGVDMVSVVAQLKELSMKVGAQEAELVKLRASNLETDLTAKPAKLSIPDKPVKHEKKSYQWNVASFRHTDGTVYTAEEVSTDKEMMKAILDVPGQGLLRELV